LHRILNKYFLALRPNDLQYRGNQYVKSKCLENHDTATCQALECFAMGTEHVVMKVGNDKVINIWACGKCAEKLR